MKVQMKREGVREGKMDKKGEKKRGKGALHYCLNIRGSTTQMAQRAKRGRKGKSSTGNEPQKNFPYGPVNLNRIGGFK